MRNDEGWAIELRVSRYFLDADGKYQREPHESIYMGSQTEDEAHEKYQRARVILDPPSPAVIGGEQADQDQSRYAPVRAGAWWPIETCRPVNNSLYLVLSSGSPYLMYWIDGVWVLTGDGDDGFELLDRFEPSHWMPLPPAPVQELSHHSVAPSRSAAQGSSSQSVPDPAIEQAREQHLYAIGRFRVSGELDPVIETLDALIQSSASRLQEVEKDLAKPCACCREEGCVYAEGCRCAQHTKTAPKLRLQEVEAERDEKIERHMDAFFRIETLVKADACHIYEEVRQIIFALANSADSVSEVGGDAGKSEQARCLKPAPAPYSCDQPRGHAGPCGQKRPGRKGVCW